MGCPVSLANLTKYSHFLSLTKQNTDETVMENRYFNNQNSYIQYAWYILLNNFLTKSNT